MSQRLVFSKLCCCADGFLKIVFNLYCKTRHLYIYVYIYVAYSRPNGWTDWAEIFCGNSWVAGGCYRLLEIQNFVFKKIFKIFFFKFVSTGNAGPFSKYYYKTLYLAFIITAGATEQNTAATIPSDLICTLHFSKKIKKYLNKLETYIYLHLSFLKFQIFSVYFFSFVC